MAFWFRWAAVALCFGATAGTISPIGRYEIAAFQWDDDAYVTNNELLTARDGLRRIWFSFDSLARHCLRSKGQIADAIVNHEKALAHSPGSIPAPVLRMRAIEVIAGIAGKSSLMTPNGRKRILQGDSKHGIGAAQ